MDRMTPLEYRKARAAIRDACSAALDRLDQLHAAMVYGEADQAREHARQLAMFADDLTALCERLVRRGSYAPSL